MKQQVVIPSGANQTTEQPCCSTGKYYAYASTLSIYVYRSEDMQLERIINYPENTILCIAGNPNINKVCTEAKDEEKTFFLAISLYLHVSFH